MWELTSGRELLSLQADSWVHTVACNSDGRTLLSGEEGGTIQIYALDVELLLALARSRITRNLTLEECQKYLRLDEVPPIP